MGYRKIPNLYKDQDILLFKECYAMEKIHGTSTHLSWNKGQLNFYSGGLSHDDFLDLFDNEDLTNKFKKLGVDKCVIFGEGYGGKCQGMMDTYGPDTRFVAFEVKIDDNWLNVINAYDVAHNQFGLDFVDYEKIPADIEHIDEQRARDSVQAVKNGMGTGHPREGIVLRPLIELRKNNDDRIIAKHKNKEFQERKNQPDPQDVDPEKLKKLEEAEEVANEWVTEMRLTHVLDQFSSELNIEDTGKIIEAMREDIKKEAKGEIDWGDKNQEIRTNKAIGKATAKMFQRRLRNKLST